MDPCKSTGVSVFAAARQNANRGGCSGEQTAGMLHEYCCTLPIKTANPTGTILMWQASLTGTSPWKEFEKVFPVPEFAATATVVVQNSGRSGIVWCDDISLWPAYKNSSYFLLRGIVLVAGILLAISAIRSVWLIKKQGLDTARHTGNYSCRRPLFSILSGNDCRCFWP